MPVGRASPNMRQAARRRARPRSRLVCQRGSHLGSMPVGPAYPYLAATHDDRAAVSLHLAHITAVRYTGPTGTFGNSVPRTKRRAQVPTEPHRPRDDAAVRQRGRSHHGKYPPRARPAAPQAGQVDFNTPCAA